MVYSISLPKENKMIVGILKEIKAEENRVSMTPAGVEVIKQNGHSILVEKAAGSGSGFDDDAYKKVDPYFDQKQSR